MKITKPMWVLLAISIIVACAAHSGRDNSYNRGVKAYQRKDYAQARTEWTAAVAEGHRSARNNLGFLLYEGLGGPEDIHQAVALWRAAATTGDSESQWHLGNAYLDGKGVAQDRAEAYAWFRCSIATTELPGADYPDSERQIGQDAHKSLNSILGLLSPQEFQRGEELAKGYMNDYAKRQ